jgi:signal transduction histidine kinase/CheY-like chemotaxis protein
VPPDGNARQHAASEHHTLVMAPGGRDAEVAEALLHEAGARPSICWSLPDVHAALGDTICCVVLSEDAVRDADLGGLGGWVADQPPWSDLPVVVLVDRDGGAGRDPLARHLRDMLGNVSFLERPFHPTSFISMIHVALKARRRQHTARAHLHEMQDQRQRLGLALAAGRFHTWDYEGGALTASDGCKALFGWPPERIFTVADLHASLREADRDSVAEMLAAPAAVGHDRACECRAIWPDGSEHRLDLRAQVLAPIAGHGIRLAGMAADISGGSDAGVGRGQTDELLERQVRRRTAELQAVHHVELERMVRRQQLDEQLRQAQKIETIGQLTGGVAHDFNNLLMVVLGNLQLLRKRIPDDPRLVRLVEGAVQGARRGAVLTQRLLAFARRQDLQPVPVDLAALVTGMQDLLVQSAGSGIDLALDLPGSLPMAMADQGQIESALLNLVANACDAMALGGTVIVRLRQEEQAGSDDLRAGAYVSITVCDTGVGMDGPTLQRAVEPFFSTKELGKGTGLGLSMVHGLAVQLRGALRLFSKPDVGTCAELWLPVAFGPLAIRPAASGPMPADALRPDPAAAVSTRILVVDDDSLVSASTAVMLEDLGHTVMLAGSGGEAMAVLRSDAAVDLMITDYAMPRMSGVDLARAARAVRPGLLVLLATGYADLPDGEGTDLPRLSKPYSQEQLAMQLSVLLANFRRPAQEV